MSGIEGDLVLVAKTSVKSGADVARRGGGNSTIRVDDCGDAGVGRTKHPSVIFNGAHTDHVEVLPGSASVTIPAVVRDIDEHVSSFKNEEANLVCEGRFVTDEGAVVMAAIGKDSAMRTCR